MADAKFQRKKQREIRDEYDNSKMSGHELRMRQTEGVEIYLRICADHSLWVMQRRKKEDDLLLLRKMQEP